MMARHTMQEESGRPRIRIANERNKERVQRKWESSNEPQLYYVAVFHSFLFVSLLVYRPVVVVVNAGLKSLEPRPIGWDPSTIAGGRRLFHMLFHSTIRYADPLADSEIQPADFSEEGLKAALPHEKHSHLGSQNH